MFVIAVSDPEIEIVWTEGPLSEADLISRLDDIATTSPGRYDVAIKHYEES